VKSLHRRLAAFLGLSGQLLWRYRYLGLAAFLTILGLVDVVWAVHPALILGAAALAVFLSIRDLRLVARESSGIDFLLRESDEYDDVDLTGASRLEAGSDVGLILIEESARLRDGPAVRVRLEDVYQLHPALEESAPLFLFRRLSKSHLWNEPALGLAGDLPTGQDLATVPLRPCDYFNFVATNLFAQTDVVVADGSETLVGKGRRLFIDRHGKLRAFRDSWLANLIGVSTLAFTSDGKLVLVRQTSHNTGSPGRYAPSGSGALDPSDLQGRNELAAIVMAGANRELCQETGVLPHEIVAEQVLAHARWLNRGGMPEFVGVSLLSVDSHELDKRPIPTEERQFTRSRQTVRLSDTDSWSRSEPLAPLPQGAAKAASLPLAIAMRALIDAMADDRLPIIRALRDRL
jgi:hypothetical protein